MRCARLLSVRCVWRSTRNAAAARRAVFALRTAADTRTEGQRELTRKGTEPLFDSSLLHAPSAPVRIALRSRSKIVIQRKTRDPTEQAGSLASSMEAPGIEPGSENASATASTCVSHRLRSPAAGQWAAHVETSHLEFRTPTGNTSAHYPGFAIRIQPPRAGFHIRTAGLTKS